MTNNEPQYSLNEPLTIPQYEYLLALIMHAQVSHEIESRKNLAPLSPEYMRLYECEQVVRMKLSLMRLFE